MSRKRYTAAWIEQQLGDELRTKRRKQGFNPNKPPSHAWLNNNGYSGLHWAARREFGKSTRELLIDICGFHDPAAPSNYWPGGHSQTHYILERYLDSLENRRQLASSTIKGRRYRLKTVIRYHIEVTGRCTILKTATSSKTAGYRIIRSVFDKLNTRHESDNSKLNYANSLVQFYDWCIREGHVDHNPAREALKDFRWTFSREGDPTPVRAEQVARLWQSCETLAEQALLVCFAGAGVRTSEPTKIDAEECLKIDEEDPRIEFPNRKNGPGTVAILAGVDVLRAHVKELRKRQNWNGKLFPSSRSVTGSVTDETLRRRITEIARRADVRLENGELPTPKNLRQYWYTQYTEANAIWFAAAEIAAIDQGSSSARVVVSHYLTSKAGRDHFRDTARSKFEACFPAEYSLVPDSEGHSQKTQRNLDEWS